MFKIVYVDDFGKMSDVAQLSNSEGRIFALVGDGDAMIDEPLTFETYEQAVNNIKREQYEGHYCQSLNEEGLNVVTID